MATNVLHVRKSELKKMISEIVEKKLADLLGDPDEGLVLRTEVRKRLLQQKKAVAKRQRGKDLEAIATRLALK